LEGVEEIYGMHNLPSVPFGTILTTAGPIMAHVSRFEVTVKGKGCHASMPAVSNNERELSTTKRGAKLTLNILQ
jgi:metal-dependent amidase/aminoacylase/carboxypeptidase family protein